MAIYLDENYFGSDPDIIGFPHLLVCMGFVAIVRLDNDKELWGVHLTNVKASTRTFEMFARQMLQTVDPKKIVAIYGSCNRVVRYGRTDDSVWKEEMMSFARMLKFNGPARGFDTGIINPRDGTYVQYELRMTQDACKIFYRQNDRMEFTGPRESTPMGHLIVQSEKRDISGLPEHLRSNPKVLEKTGGDRIESTPFSTGGARPVKGSLFGKGKLREVDYSLRLTEKYVYC